MVGSGDVPRGVDERVARHRHVASLLASSSDARLAALVEDGSVAWATGVGGASGVLDVGGAPVFVKRIALTDRERRPAATITTSGWVLDRRSEAFPLVHHWRALPGAPALAAEHADVDAAVAYRAGSPAVRDRLDALADASASVVLFLEHIPHTVADWLAGRAALGERSALAAAALLEAELLAGVALMTTGGLVHFDAHFDNVLTDGHRVYFADLGLATSTRFALSTEEARFADRARTHDVGYVIARLVNWLIVTLGPADGPVERNEFLRACAAGADPVGLPPAAAAIVRRYAPVATVMNEFYAALFTTRRDLPYPAEALGDAIAGLGRV